MAKTNNIFINFVHEALIHINTRQDGKQFANISIPCAESKTGYASFAVNMGQLFPATKRDGSVVDGYKSVLLGKPEQQKKLSVATNKKATNWKDITVTVQQLKDMFEKSREAYKAANAGETVA